MTKIVVVQGSVRPNNNTAKAVAVVAKYVGNMPGLEIDVIDPTHMELALPGRGITEDAKAMQQKLREANGVVLVTPEYHGSYSSTMKLLIDNMGFPSGLSGKPIALLGVAAGRIGAIKALEHLRSVASHVGGLVLPGPVSIASVNNVFDKDGNLLDNAVEGLIHKLVDGLVEYIRATTCPDYDLEQFAREKVES